MSPFRIADAIDVGIAEPSDVASLSGGRFFVVSDTAPVGVIVGRGRKAARVDFPRLSGKTSGFEAVAVDSDGGRLFVVREERRELHVFAWAGRAATPIEPLFVRELPKLGKKKKGANKGVEGMTWLPAACSPTRKACLVLAKEAKPRALLLYDPDRDVPIEVRLDPAIEDACADFSGLAVYPKTGRLFLCSDESATVAELMIEGARSPRAKLVRVTELRGRQGTLLKRVEGVAVDAVGDVHVLLENDAKLWRFTRRR